VIRDFCRKIPRLYWQANWTDADPWTRAFTLIFCGYYLYLLGCLLTPGVKVSPYVTGPVMAVIMIRAAWIAVAATVGLIREEIRHAKLRRQNKRLKHRLDEVLRQMEES